MDFAHDPPSAPGYATVPGASEDTSPRSSCSSIVLTLRATMNSDPLTLAWSLMVHELPSGLTVPVESGRYYDRYHIGMAAPDMSAIIASVLQIGPDPF